MICANAIAMARPRAPPPNHKLALPKPTMSTVRRIIDSARRAR